jgi:hypothetical protein
VKKSIPAIHKGFYFTIIGFVLASFACRPAPVVMATSTPSVTVTLTSSPTNTPAPTVTIQPSATFTPSPTITPLVPDLGQVLFSENFDDMELPFYICGAAHIESGVLVVERGPEEPSPCGMFSGALYGNEPISVDTTLLVRFKTTSDFNIGIHAGEYGSDTLRRFSYGITQGIGTWDLMQGNNIQTWRTHGTTADRWYTFSIRLSSTGNVQGKLWQVDDPKDTTVFEVTLGDGWDALPYYFVSDFKDVPFLVDEYQILSNISATR